LSPLVTDSDPGGKNISQGVLPVRATGVSDEAANRTADALNSFTRISHEILDKHRVNKDRVSGGLLAANGVITRGVGSYRDYRNILHYLNLKIAVVAGESTIIGLGKLFNFTTLSDDSFTSLTDTNISGKLDTARNALSDHDMAFVHIKGTDIAAHDRDPLGKSQFIHRFDTALEGLDTNNLIVAICADHSTDSLKGEHNGDPVPVLIHNPVGRRDLTVRFNETDSSSGALSRLTAQSFLISTLDAMGCLTNFKPSDTEFFRVTL
jgi:2,3-bisphosphoglycerate-independent phosphoglycerate mutase